MKKFFVFTLGLLSLLKGYAQSVGINATGTSPHPSAMLDVQSTSKGMLIPRMTTAQRTAIATPAQGLLVYDTDTNTFWFYNASAWTNLSAAIGAGWLLTGNAGTVNGTNFIGTTDNIPFNIRVNNQKAGRIDNILFNTFWGYQAGNSNTTGNYNTANGYQALFLNTTGSQNTANGYVALYSNTGNNNTATGIQALYANTTGYENIANGNFALRNNTTGYDNIANGYNALYANTTGNSNIAIGVDALFNNTIASNVVAIGDFALYHNAASQNTAVGSKALYSNTTGNSNTADGYNALYSNTTGSSNIANGYNALYANTTGTNNTATGYNALSSNNGNFNTANGVGALELNTGSYNTAIGVQALVNNIAGSSNTALGYGADVSSVALTNATAIGANAKVGSSNSLVLGGTGGNAVNVGIGTSTPNNKLQIGSMGATGFNGNDLALGNGTNATGFFQSNSNLQVYSSTNIALMPQSGAGRVGINTTTPRAPLEVDGNATAAFPNTYNGYAFYSTRFNSDGTPNSSEGGIYTTTDGLVSIYASDRVLASEFDAFSDARIKDIIDVSNTTKDLQAINHLKITDYTMKDKVKYGNKPFKKVIAQQVEKVYPQVVSKHTDFIPNVYQLAGEVEKVANGYLLHFDNSHHISSTAKKLQLLLSDKNGMQQFNIVSIPGDKEVIIEATDLDADKIFVYGEEVNDFRTVDYEGLTTLNISATQELSKIIAIQNKKIEAMEREIKWLERKRD